MKVIERGSTVDYFKLQPDRQIWPFCERIPRKKESIATASHVTHSGFACSWQKLADVNTIVLLDLIVLREIVGATICTISLLVTHTTKSSELHTEEEESS